MDRGATLATLETLRKPETMGTASPILFFASEHTSQYGWQCTDGAYETGLMASNNVFCAAEILPQGSLDVDLDGSIISGPTEELRSVNVAHLRTICQEYASSFGHFYDVLEEIWYQLHLGNTGAGANGTNTDVILNNAQLPPSKRHKLWRMLHKNTGSEGLRF